MTIKLPPTHFSINILCLPYRLQEYMSRFRYMGRSNLRRFSPGFPSDWQRSPIFSPRLSSLPPPPQQHDSTLPKSNCQHHLLLPSNLFSSIIPTFCIFLTSTQQTTSSSSTQSITPYRLVPAATCKAKNLIGRKEEEFKKKSWQRSTPRPSPPLPHHPTCSQKRKDN